MTLSLPSARVELATARALLDEALERLNGVVVEGAPAREVAALVGDGLRGVYDAQRADGDLARFDQSVRASLDLVHHAWGTLHPWAGLDPAVGAATMALAYAWHALSRVPGAGYDLARREGSDGGVVAASRDEPRVLDWARPSLAARVPIAPQRTRGGPNRTRSGGSRGASLAALRARAADAQAALAQAEDDAPRGAPSRAPGAPDAGESLRRSVMGAARSQEAVVAERARAALDDLAVLGARRRHTDLPGQTWLGRERAEQRLLARLDALVAAGHEVLPGLVEALARRPLPDPELTWALVFVFGSLTGDDALDQALRLARTAPLELRDMRDAVADALALAPHEGIDPALAGWTSAPDVDRRVVAFRALGRRGAVTLAQLRAGADDPKVAVVRECAVALRACDAAGAGELFASLLAHDDLATAMAATESALLRGHPGAVGRALSRCAEGRGDAGDAAVWVALGAGEDALEVLRGAVAEGGVVTLEAAGWFGHLALVDPLVERLKDPKRAIRRAAAGALERITGASIDDQPPRTSSKRATPSPQASHHRSPPERVGAWRDWLARWLPTADARRRHRFGAPFTVRQCLDEVESADATARERRLAAVELAARSGLSLPLDTRDFVARQRRQLGAWRALLDAEVGRRAPGGWQVPRRREVAR